MVDHLDFSWICNVEKVGEDPGFFNSIETEIKLIIRKCYFQKA